MAFNKQQNLTIYGRNPVKEALEDLSLQITRLHLAETNRSNDDINRLKQLAELRGIEVRTHDKLGLSRISKNGKQDQGVAADIFCPNFHDADGIESGIYIAVDRIGNPNNLGMLARSVAAFGGKLIVAEDGGNTKISPLVVKASAGALFKCPIYRSHSLKDTAQRLLDKDFDVVSLSAVAPEPLYDYVPNENTLFLLGNETDGISDELKALCNRRYYIPMSNNVESLNVAVTGSIVSFMLSS